MFSHSSIYILNSEKLNDILNVGIIKQIMYCISAYICSVDCVKKTGLHLCIWQVKVGRILESPYRGIFG